MMDPHLDGLLDELVPAEPRAAWSDVLRRARRSRRRYAAVVAAIALLVLAPATWAAVDAFEGTPAPPDVATSFGPYERFVRAQHVLAGDGPQVDASKAHGVIEIDTADGPEDLWAAPDDAGGQCWYIDWANDKSTDGKYGLSGCEPPQPPASNIEWGDLSVPSHPTLMTFRGSLNVDAATVRVTLDGGSTQRLPVAEHLFLGSFPKGTKVERVTALDADGNVVATSTRP